MGGPLRPAGHRPRSEVRGQLLYHRHDQRDDKEVTIADNVQATVRLVNPTRTTLYSVLVKPDRVRALPGGPWPPRRTGRSLSVGNGLLADVLKRVVFMDGRGRLPAFQDELARTLASRRWRALNGSPLLADVLKRVVFMDGIKQEDAT